MAVNLPLLNFRLSICDFRLGNKGYLFEQEQELKTIQNHARIPLED
jgi:hypothetical protein